MYEDSINRSRSQDQESCLPNGLLPNRANTTPARSSAGAVGAGAMALRGADAMSSGITTAVLPAVDWAKCRVNQMTGCGNLPMPHEQLYSTRTPFDPIVAPAGDPKAAAGLLKVDLSMVPSGAIIEEAKVLAIGAAKYGFHNWRTGEGIRARVYTAAIMRHLLAYQDGEDTDPESGFSHLAHIRATAGILLDAKAVDKLIDNRSKLKQ